jgi:nitrite reductase/ring-hydroxylating ferredoxin subunit
MTMDPTIAPFPPRLIAYGVSDASPFQDLLALDDLPAGSMTRVSVGELDGCIVACPLHEGRFDLRSGDPAQMPTTGGLDPDGIYHPTWTPGGRSDKPDVPGKKAEARRLTRIRRMRYFPVRVAGGRILVALPAIDAV